MAPVGSTGRRHPHKPLLLLWLLGRQQRDETGPVAYEDAQEPVDRLIAEFGTPARRAKDRAATPFFHLELRNRKQYDVADFYEDRREGR